MNYALRTKINSWFLLWLLTVFRFNDRRNITQLIFYLFIFRTISDTCNYKISCKVERLCIVLKAKPAECYMKKTSRVVSSFSCVVMAIKQRWSRERNGISFPATIRMLLILLIFRRIIDIFSFCFKFQIDLDIEWVPRSLNDMMFVFPAKAKIPLLPPAICWNVKVSSFAFVMNVWIIFGFSFVGFFNDSRKSMFKKDQLQADVCR